MCHAQYTWESRNTECYNGGWRWRYKLYIFISYNVIRQCGKRQIGRPLLNTFIQMFKMNGKLFMLNTFYWFNTKNQVTLPHTSVFWKFHFPFSGCRSERPFISVHTLLSVNCIRASLDAHSQSSGGSKSQQIVNWLTTHKYARKYVHQMHKFIYCFYFQFILWYFNGAFLCPSRVQRNFVVFCIFCWLNKLAHHHFWWLTTLIASLLYSFYSINNLNHFFFLPQNVID